MSRYLKCLTTGHPFLESGGSCIIPQELLQFSWCSPPGNITRAQNALVKDYVKAGLMPLARGYVRGNGATETSSIADRAILSLICSILACLFDPAAPITASAVSSAK
jgi:hypothetical protein